MSIKGCIPDTGSSCVNALLYHFPRDDKLKALNTCGGMEQLVPATKKYLDDKAATILRGNSAATIDEKGVPIIVCLGVLLPKVRVTSFENNFHEVERISPVLITHKKNPNRDKETCTISPTGEDPIVFYYANPTCGRPVYRIQLDPKAQNIFAIPSPPGGEVPTSIRTYEVANEMAELAREERTWDGCYVYPTSVGFQAVPLNKASPFYTKPAQPTQDLSRCPVYYLDARVL